jgi:5-(carboxyamino)imidazole ribonucleotide synthase
VTQLLPNWRVLEICQNRLREKTWLRQNGIPHAKFREVAADGDLSAAIRDVGVPCVVKTADFGYDGKGQLKVMDEAGIATAAKQFAGQRAVVERFVDFRCELSVVVARGPDGCAETFPVAENIHTNHILDFSIVPARVSPEIVKEAENLGRDIAAKLDVVGLIAIELFWAADGTLLVNEMAPRPHNSGHYSLDACRTSQFEQHVRAVCGLPLGDVSLTSPVVIVNILGDKWLEDDGKSRRAPNWPAILADPAAKLHLYGKAEPRVGRKMGHFSVVGVDAEAALERARNLKAQL